MCRGKYHLRYKVFKSLYDKALKKEQDNIEAIVISSYDKHRNEISSRYVNLKFVINDEWIFFSNYDSPKSKDFNEHNQISALFFWPLTNVQIRLKGIIKKTTKKFNKEYFTKRDVVTIARDGGIGIAVVLRIRNGKIFSRDSLHLKQLTTSKEDILKTVITRFYMDSDFLPEEISLQYPPSDESGLRLFLKEKNKKRVGLIYPKIGEKAKELTKSK